VSGAGGIVQFWITNSKTARPGCRKTALSPAKSHSLKGL
jgi:hypothetical protein